MVASLQVLESRIGSHRHDMAGFVMSLGVKLFVFVDG